MRRVPTHPLIRSQCRGADVGVGVFVVALLLTLLLGGCALQPASLDSFEVPARLLSGERLFADPIDLDAEAPDVAVSEPDEAIRGYVAANVNPSVSATARFRQLIGALARDGYFDTAYSPNLTLTAAGAFEIRGGNCLSYTNMFIALAREAGLDAVYQVVDVPPSWDAEANFLIRYAHINVLIKNVHLDRQFGQTVVDFNDVRLAPDYPRREVSDAYAKALYYANHSVALLKVGEARAGFAHLLRAINTDPSNADLWVNLGAFYAVQGTFAGAAEAYQIALRINADNKSALSGLARSYANLGDESRAAQYLERVRNYREANPFYHYALAKAAFDEADFENSLNYINAAIGLSRRTGRFHLLKGLVEQQLGDYDAAQASFHRARRHGLDANVEADLRRLLVNLGST
jgi:tetratricopeptide (TPR) repeat protein